MRSAEAAEATGAFAAAAAAWDIAVPPAPGRLPGVTMAGFRGRGRAPVDLRIVPYPAVTVAVDLGEGPLVVEDGRGGEHHGSLVTGLAPGTTRAHGRDVECLQIRLSPVVAHTVLGGAAPALGRTVVALDELWGRDAPRIQEQLRSAPSWDERFTVAVAALGRRHEAGPAVDPEVAAAWDRMVASRGQVRIEGLAGALGWSRKRLWSRFRSQIGLTPKRAAQLVRFDHAAHRLAAGHEPAQVAAEAGYVDQSHLHRATTAFAALTPAALATAPWLAVDDVAWSPRGRGHG